MEEQYRVISDEEGIGPKFFPSLPRAIAYALSCWINRDWDARIIVDNHPEESDYNLVFFDTEGCESQ